MILKATDVMSRQRRVQFEGNTCNNYGESCLHHSLLCCWEGSNVGVVLWWM